MNKPTEENLENKNLHDVQSIDGEQEGEISQELTEANKPSEVKSNENKPAELKSQRQSEGRQKASKASNKNNQDKEASEFIEQVISINRITKVTKGGKKLSFSALVVVGDTKGNVGYSLSKAREVATAIRKAMGVAKRNMISVSLKGTTITHEIIGQCGGARVLLKPASEGTGVIASGPVRAVCDGAGIHNILTKCHRSNNPINVVKATINGLSRLKSVN